MSAQPSDDDIATWIASTSRRVQRSTGSSSAVLERRFDVGRERMWTAFTDPEQLRGWLGSVHGDLREGETVKIEVGAPHTVTCRILDCERPNRMKVTWWYGGFPPDHVDEVELRLGTDGHDTRLLLEHRSRDTGDWWLGAGAGWEFA